MPSAVSFTSETKIIGDHSTPTAHIKNLEKAELARPPIITKKPPHLTRELTETIIKPDKTSHIDILTYDEIDQNRSLTDSNHSNSKNDKSEVVERSTRNDVTGNDFYLDIDKARPEVHKNIEQERVSSSKTNRTYDQEEEELVLEDKGKSTGKNVAWTFNDRPVKYVVGKPTIVTKRLFKSTSRHHKVSSNAPDLHPLTLVSEGTSAFVTAKHTHLSPRDNYQRGNQHRQKVGTVKHTGHKLGTVHHTGHKVGIVQHTGHKVWTVNHTGHKAGTVNHTGHKVGTVQHSVVKKEDKVTTTEQNNIRTVEVIPIKQSHQQLTKNLSNPKFAHSESGQSTVSDMTSTKKFSTGLYSPFYMNRPHLAEERYNTKPSDGHGTKRTLSEPRTTGRHSRTHSGGVKHYDDDLAFDLNEPYDINTTEVSRENHKNAGVRFAETKRTVSEPRTTTHRRGTTTTTTTYYDENGLKVTDHEPTVHVSQSPTRTYHHTTEGGGQNHHFTPQPQHNTSHNIARTHHTTHDSDGGETYHSAQELGHARKLFRRTIYREESSAGYGDVRNWTHKQHRAVQGHPLRGSHEAEDVHIEQDGHHNVQGDTYRVHRGVRDPVTGHRYSVTNGHHSRHVSTVHTNNEHHHHRNGTNHQERVTVKHHAPVTVTHPTPPMSSSSEGSIANHVHSSEKVVKTVTTINGNHRKKTVYIEAKASRFPPIHERHQQQTVTSVNHVNHVTDHHGNHVHHVNHVTDHHHTNEIDIHHSSSVHKEKNKEVRHVTLWRHLTEHDNWPIYKYMRSDGIAFMVRASPENMDYVRSSLGLMDGVSADQQALVPALPKVEFDADEEVN